MLLIIITENERFVNIGCIYYCKFSTRSRADFCFIPCYCTNTIIQYKAAFVKSFSQNHYQKISVSLTDCSTNDPYHSFDFIVGCRSPGAAICRLRAGEKNSLDFFACIGYNKEYMWVFFCQKSDIYGCGKGTVR